jgi:hypothetical protein
MWVSCKDSGLKGTCQNGAKETMSADWFESAPYLMLNLPADGMPMTGTKIIG